MSVLIVLYVPCRSSVFPFDGSGPKSMLMYMLVNKETIAATTGNCHGTHQFLLYSQASLRVLSTMGNQITMIRQIHSLEKQRGNQQLETQRQPTAVKSDNTIGCYVTSISCHRLSLTRISHWFKQRFLKMLMCCKFIRFVWAPIRNCQTQNGC